LAVDSDRSAGICGSGQGIIEYSSDTGINFSNIFFPTGSAGTQSGLIAGKAIYGLNSEINGIAITKNAEQITEEVSALTDGISEFLKSIGLNVLSGLMTIILARNTEHLRKRR